MKRSFLSIIVLTASFFMLSACGQKGPLYLPEKQQAPIINQTNETTTTQPTDTQETKETKASQQ